MNKKRILLVDDDSGIREIVTITLQALTTWEVLTVASGQEAIAIIQAQQPDAILLDMMMPKMDGIETLKQIQANHATKSIPVILMTAKTMSQNQQELANLVIVGMISKPFKASELVAKVRSILQWQD